MRAGGLRAYFVANTRLKQLQARTYELTTQQAYKQAHMCKLGNPISCEHVFGLRAYFVANTRLKQLQACTYELTKQQAYKQAHMCKLGNPISYEHIFGLRARFCCEHIIPVQKNKHISGRHIRAQICKLTKDVELGLMLFYQKKTCFQ